MKFLRTLLTPLAALLLASPLAAQIVEGKVLDRATGQPVDEAMVEILRSNGRAASRTRTDAQGNFIVTVMEAGEYRIRASRVGYQTSTSLPLDVELRQTVRADMQISRSEVVLDPLIVTARSTPPRSRTLDREDFYARERRGFGRFITSHEISRMSTTATTSIFSTVAGVRVVPAGGSRYAIVISRGSDCAPRILVDNMPVQTTDLNDVIRPEHIAGIEVYRGASEIPARWLSLRNSCGLVLIWSNAADG